MKRLKVLKHPETLPVVPSPRALPSQVSDGFTPNLQLLPRSSLDGNYYVGEALGAGSSAEVKIATDKQTGRKVAVKTFNKAGLTPTIEARIRKEYALMRHLTHKNLVALIDVIENPQEIIIIMEYAAGGDLHSYLGKQPNWKLDENNARNIFKQVAKGVRHLHRCGFVHRDLKLENILLDGDRPRAMVADLGYGTVWNLKEVTNTPCGSLYFAAPEIVNADAYIGPEIDVWSLGVVLYALTSGCLPFLDPTEDDHKTAVLIRSGKYEVWPSWSKHLRHLLQGMLCVDQRKRMTMNEVLVHKWLKPRRRSQGLSFFTKKGKGGKERKEGKARKGGSPSSSPPKDTTLLVTPVEPIGRSTPPSGKEAS